MLPSLLEFSRLVWQARAGLAIFSSVDFKLVLSLAIFSSVDFLLVQLLGLFNGHHARAALRRVSGPRACATP